MVKMILQIFNVLLHPIFLLTADYKGPDSAKLCI